LVSGEETEEQKTHYFNLVRYNGGSILYSSAREYLKLVASRFPLGIGFQLPTVSPKDAFIPPAKES
jgi:hypothetical protein